MPPSGPPAVPPAEGGEETAAPAGTIAKNPQEEEDSPEETPSPASQEDSPAKSTTTTSTTATSVVVAKKVATVQTELSTDEKAKACSKLAVVEEDKKEGAVSWNTYKTYLLAVGLFMCTMIVLAIAGIMVFQLATSLWITYWTDNSRPDHFLHPYVTQWPNPQSPEQFLKWYMWLVIFFCFFNFLGHGLEIIGGIDAAKRLFAEGLSATLDRPIRWWDVNPTGRVLNRFSEDVEVMDCAITNILGVMVGAVLYFIGHTIFLALVNPFSLLLLPLIMIAFEYFAKYYRSCIRELHRIVLVSMSTVYQGMVEAMVGGATIRAFAEVQRVVCHSLDGLDTLQRLLFIKQSVSLWVSLRLQLVGYTLAAFNTCYPVFQYFGWLPPRSAGLVGFSITYSMAVNGIIQQMIFNFSDLEMQLVSIERLKEYSKRDEDSTRARGQLQICDQNAPRGLQMEAVTVVYREGLPPALRDVTLNFLAGEVAAIVGRTGAGKSSLLLAILQLVPYEGRIAVDGEPLGALEPEDVRRRLVGIVPQSPVLFAGDLRLNLDPEGRQDDAALWAVLKSVGLLPVCSDRRGLEAPVAAGVVGGDKGVAADAITLSQGQRQLLCAARVLLRKPRVALLDEITASLGEDLAQTVLDTLLGRFRELAAAVLLVTHQLALAEQCQRIVTVASGKVVEDRRTASRS
eukprot:gnl/TRDRNA2_/TRDRNA2_149120_c1_seq1.p1 gnl/TRDRNA2_/TRDRNA2_149120_c1~~gnl/TRDRNA2_/TRDRNA2_149120_c1_seq1.p1  ORF type:complete len:709 (-),score=136.43 gnl/TRDRNA2_/TRDRNA2_149120_c1_seq1:26-2074(-)